VARISTPIDETLAYSMFECNKSLCSVPDYAWR